MSKDTFLSDFYRAEQIDSLHVSLITLIEMTVAGEIELILEQPKKSLKQKLLYLEKVIRQLPSTELQEALIQTLSSGDIEFFGKHTFIQWLRATQKQAEAIRIVNLTVAVDFKEEDLQEMASEFGKQIGQQAAFQITIDRTLIGGAVIRYGNYISDYSLKTRLAQFRTNWRSAAISK